MPDYSYGKIYKIWTENSDDIYIGSTVQTVSMRMSDHRRHYKIFLKTGKGYCSSYILLEQGNIHYELIEKYPCENKQQLCKREGHWQKKLKCVNMLIAGRTKKGWHLDNPNYYKEYHEKNKLKIAKQKKEYNQKNKLKIAKQKKEYRQKNKEEISKHQKKWYEKNKEKILKRRNEKNICICCDGRYTTGNWTKHSRTKKHVKAQKLQEQLQDLIPLYHQ